MRFLLVLLLSLLLAGCVSLAEDVTPPPGYVPPTPAPTVSVEVFPASAPDVNSGAAIYAEKCAPCHGPTGQGDGPQAAQLPVSVPALGRAEVAFGKSPAQWYQIVTQGNLQSFMPGFTSLTDQQRWDVVAYALSLSASAEQVQAGRALYEINCAQCHGPDGRQLPNASLADQKRMAARSNQQLVALIQKGIPPAMPPVNLVEADAANLVAYVRTFTFAASTQMEASASGSDASSTSSSDLSSAPPSASASTGVISGKITNASGAPLPSGLKVTLHGFVHDVTTGQFNEGETRQAVVSADGTYRFENVPLSPADAYYVSVEYNGVTYESQPAIPANDGLSAYDLPVTLYETTTDTSALVISTAHILLDYSNPGVVQVVEYLIFANMGDKTIVAPEAGKPVIEIPLPAGYQNLQFEQGILGGRFVQTASGFGDTLPILPSGTGNEYALVFAFELPYPADSSLLSRLFGGPKLELSQTFPLKTGMLNLLVPQGVKAEGSSLQDGGVQNMGSGFTFQLYRAGSLEAGQTFSAVISGAPQMNTAVSSTSASANQGLVLGIGAFGVVLLLAGVFLYLRDRRREQEEEPLEDVYEPDEETMSEEDILDAIIALDDQFRAGNLSEEAYQARRAELKAMLQNLLR